jgi:hypothetical protein
MDARSQSGACRPPASAPQPLSFPRPREPLSSAPISPPCCLPLRFFLSRKGICTRSRRPEPLATWRPGGAKEKLPQPPTPDLAEFLKQPPRVPLLLGLRSPWEEETWGSGRTLEPSSAGTGRQCPRSPQCTPDYELRSGCWGCVPEL